MYTCPETSKIQKNGKTFQNRRFRNCYEKNSKIRHESTNSRADHEIVHDDAELFLRKI